MVAPVTEIQFDSADGFTVTDLGGGVVRIDSTGSGSAPADAVYIVGVLHAGLSAERVVTDTATVAWDLTVASQAKANVPDNAVTYAKLQDGSGFSVVGKSTTGAGDNADIIAADNTVFGRSAAGNLVFAALATAQIANDAVTYAKVQNGTGFSVVGKPDTAAGDNTDILAGADSILGRSGSGNIAFGTIVTNQIGAAQVTYAKLQNGAGFSVVGKTATGAGDNANIVAGDETVFGRTAAGNLVFAALATGQIANNAVTYAKMQDISATSRILGRITAAAGDTEELTPAQARTVADVDWSKAITVEDPTNAEDISMFFTEDAITITKMAAVLIGSATPSVTWTVRHSTDRSAAGNEVVTGGTTTTSTTVGSIVTAFNDATIPAASFVWLETTAKSGTVDELHLTVQYTKD